MKSAYYPQKIYIDEEAAELPLSKKIRSKFPDMVEIVDVNHRGSCLPAAGGQRVPAERIWHLTKHKGKFLKLCPGTKKYLCCNYWILNIVQGCPFSCSYCAIQAYDFPFFKIFANLEDSFSETEKVLKKYPQKFFRIGTGEFTDSLALDEYLDINGTLIEFFSRQENAILELKTKADNIGKLLSINPKGRVIVSWSVNTPQIIKKEEKGAPDLLSRLQAAKKCEGKGYWTGFHFDPIVHYDNWEDDYLAVVENIFKYVNPERIAWISLGALRFVSELGEMIQKKHLDSKIIYGELLPGLDNKLRYFKHIRMDMFKKIADKIRGFDDKIPVYLCMESPEVWEKTLRWRPGNNGEIDKFLGRKFMKEV